MAEVNKIITEQISNLNHYTSLIYKTLFMFHNAQEHGNRDSQNPSIHVDIYHYKHVPTKLICSQIGWYQLYTAR